MDYHNWLAGWSYFWTTVLAPQHTWADDFKVWAAECQLGTMHSLPNIPGI